MQSQPLPQTDLVYHHLPPAPPVPSVLSSSNSSQRSWSSLFNTGSVRQFMTGVQDTLKDGLMTPAGEILTDHGAPIPVPGGREDPEKEVLHTMWWIRLIAQRLQFRKAGMTIPRPVRPLRFPLQGMSGGQHSRRLSVLRSTSQKRRYYYSMRLLKRGV